MNASVSTSFASGGSDAVFASQDFPSCSVISPSWPLNRWIAVNPWWGLRHLEAERYSQVPGVRQKTSIFMPSKFYYQAWQGGRIREEDLRAAAAELRIRKPLAELVAALKAGDAAPKHPAPLMLDQQPVATSVAPLGAVREQVARACSLFFDERQSRGLVKDLSPSLFENWLVQARHDLSLDQRTGLAGARDLLKAVSGDPGQAYDWACKNLGLSEESLGLLANRLLYELAGWASLCRGDDWRDALEERQSSLTREILIVLLIWEAVAVRLASVDQRHRWQRAWARSRNGNTAQSGPAEEALCVWHRAFELGYLRRLVMAVSAGGQSPIHGRKGATTVAAQAVFCIDVRSEVIRRHLEVCAPELETIGFAGFFGMPIEHQTLTNEENRARLPGLLAPVYRLVDSTGNLEQDRALRRLAETRDTIRQSVRKAKYSSFSSFSLVESTGLAWAWKLVRDSLNQGRHRACPDSNDDRVASAGRLHHRLGGDPVSDSERVSLAEALLRGMSKTTDFASLLVFVGHGSHTDNNPQQSSLACGACGGQNGGLNARAAAELMNDPAVRAGLVGRGIRVPDFTLAVAAEHCTVTDRVHILDRALVPDAYLDALMKLENTFSEAGRRTRRERATALGLNGLNDDTLLHDMVSRTSDWSEVRPEWGLANNAAIVFAKRSRTRGINLQGRVFLHDYDPTLDPEGAILEGLMTAPMIVANWINLQYLGSIACPDTFGAGNKLLHSVVGGNLGVVEGNNPDLRLGLSLQSVHDGHAWRHEPIRLHVLIDAPAERIEHILAAQPDVRDLVQNRWLWLCRFGEQGVQCYRNGRWADGLPTGSGG